VSRMEEGHQEVAGTALGGDMIEVLRRTLRHPRQEELSVRLAEVVGGRPYLRHGIEVRPGDVVLDVGANIGVASACFALEGAGEVHSFEPIGAIYAYLEENLRRFPACVPHHYGVGSRSGPRKMTYYPEICEISSLSADPERDRALLRQILLRQGGSETQVDRGLEGRFRTERLTCEFRTLSDVLRGESIDRVDLLKLDVEGAELEVLQGIEEGDWPAIGQVSGELHLDPPGRDRFLALLGEHGFHVTLEQEPDMAGTPLHLFSALRR
jgi:31-O-methyltransferase